MEDRSLRLFLFRLIPTLMLVSMVAWCSLGRHPSAGSGPALSSELAELFAQNGLLDGPAQPDQFAAIAKRAGPAGMNRLLYAAAPDASLPALRWIVEHGADPRNLGSIEGVPLLHKVAKRPQHDRLAYFLEQGLDPRQRDSEGRTLMHVCAEGGIDERVYALLSAKGSSVSDTTRAGKQPIHFASVKSIAVLAAAGADLAAQDGAGRTALHWAALEGRNDVVIELLRLGASVFVVDQQGRTPLHLAALRQSEVAIDALLVAGAPRTARDNDGRTPRELGESGYKQPQYRQERARMIEKL